MLLSSAIFTFASFVEMIPKTLPPSEINLPMLFVIFPPFPAVKFEKIVFMVHQLTLTKMEIWKTNCK
jgi:hypothetical protein